MHHAVNDANIGNGNLARKLNRMGANVPTNSYEFIET